MNKTNIQPRFQLLSLFITFSLLCLFPSCEARAQEQSSSIIEVDANYMKEHIYDFEANPTNFIYTGDKPAIIDFYASWCGPCRALAPKLREVAKEYEGQLVIYKIDIDKNPDITAHFGVESIPTILFVPLQGKPYLSKGNLPMQSIRTMVEKILPKK